ncbi:MAG: hypothetical protein QM706_02015 [Nitrospira sp.]
MPRGATDGEQAHHHSQRSPNALTVSRQHYVAKNARGDPVESPSDTVYGVADDIASAEPSVRGRRLARPFYEIKAR